MGDLSEQLKQAQEKADIDPLRIAYARLFTTPDGKVVLADLRKQFYDCLLTKSGSTELSITAKAAQHDVIAVILKLIGDET